MSRQTEKIIAFCLGLVFFLLVLEGALRLYGAVYSWRHDHYLRSFRSAKNDARVILCLGNCYTAGTGAPKGQSYPDHLQREFNEKEPDDRVKVINRGQAGINSAEVLDNLPRHIYETSPDLIVLQTGSPNRRNLHKYSEYLERENAGRAVRVPVLFESRVVRFVMLLMNGARTRIENQRMAQERRKAWEAREPDAANLKRADIAGQDHNGKRSGLMHNMKKIVRRLWREVKMLRYQFPVLRAELMYIVQETEHFPQALFHPRDVQNADISRWVASDIRRIVAICRSKGIEVVIMTYPVPLDKAKREDKLFRLYIENMESVNNVVRSVAAGERVRLVENSDLFIAYPPGKDLMHPDSKGYRRIAENAYETIARDNLLAGHK